MVAGNGRQHEDVDDVPPRPIDERRERLARDQVAAAADQSKALMGEIDARRRERTGHRRRARREQHLLT
jgi:hypothetical protein